MVKYGKTIYPGKVIKRNLDTLMYLVRYDGLGANRNEWRQHSELMDIHEASAGRRKRAAVAAFIPSLH